MNRFFESQINNAVLKKLEHRKANKRSPHPILWILLNGEQVLKVKIPNDHKRLFSNNKAEKIAKALKINMDEFSKLVNCTLTGPAYLQLLQDRLNNAPSPYPSD